MQWEYVSSLLLCKSKQLLILLGKKKTYCRSTATQVCSSAPIKVPYSTQHLLLMLWIAWIYYNFYYLTKIREVRFMMTSWWCLEHVCLWMITWHNWLEKSFLIIWPRSYVLVKPRLVVQILLVPFGDRAHLYAKEYWKVYAWMLLGFPGVACILHAVYHLS